MFRFASPEYLNLLYIVLPALIAIYWLAGRIHRRSMDRFTSKELREVLSPNKGKYKPLLKFGILSFSLLLIILALANPQVGTKIEEVKQVGIDVYIALDVSLSMTAEDIKPSRLEKAKNEISQLIRRLRGDRIGLIVFSGEAYVQIPLTTDYAAANLFLSAVSVKSVPQPGTAVASAIELAVNSFKGDEGTKKTIIVITDGEDHEGDLKKVVDEAVEKGISIYAIGLGSPTGVPIPVYNQSGFRTAYKRDNKGNVVLTKLDETTLQEITRLGNGKYYRASNTSDELEEIYKDLSKIEETEFGATKITDYEDRFYWFLFPAILLILIEFFIPLTRSKIFVLSEK
jgi:Ca-activated chloride channel family protein